MAGRREMARWNDLTSRSGLARRGDLARQGDTAMCYDMARHSDMARWNDLASRSGLASRSDLTRWRWSGLARCTPQKEAQADPQKDAGNVTITTAFIVIPLSLLLVAALGCSILFTRWSMLSSQLAAARETTMTSGFQMMLKSSEEPGRLLAGKLAGELRRAGVDDELVVWFAESQDETLGDGARALAYYAVLTETYGEDTLLGTLDIPCSTTASIIAYATEHVYRPSNNAAVQAYRFAYGSTTGVVTTLASGGQLPQPLVDALAESESLARSR